MVTSTHETLHRFFRDHPEAIDRTFRAAGMKKFPPTVRAWELPNDVTTIGPLERRVDSAMRFQAKDGRTFIVVFEAQRRPDNAKRRSWPYYITYLHERYKCPVMLVVTCQDEATVRWARIPVRITTGFWTSFSLYPCVLGPHNVPTMDTVDESDLLLGALSVITHAKSIKDSDMQKLALALKQADPETRADLWTYVELGLGSLPVASMWGKMMSMDLETLRSSAYIRELLDEHDRKLVAESKAEGILLILHHRSVEVSRDERERISACTDLVQLDAWFDAALDAASAADLLG